MRDAEPDVVHQMPASRCQWRIGLAGIPGQRHITEPHACLRRAVHTVLGQRWPGCVLRSRHLAIGFGMLDRPRRQGWKRSLQMPLIPQLGAERSLLEHVHVVETLERQIAEIFDQRVLGATQIGKACATQWLDAFGFRVGDLRPGQSQHAARARPGVAVDEDIASVVRGKQWCQGDLGPRLEQLEVPAHVLDFPAEMPKGGCGRVRWRRHRHLAEEDQHVVG